MSPDLATEKVSVLVVDDSADQRMLLCAFFEKAGCAVANSASAEEALLECSENEPELMVIDLMLPGMNGWELAERVRDRHPKISIAISSVLREMRYPSYDAVLPKPFSRATVLGVLTKCVPRWEAA